MSLCAKCLELHKLVGDGKREGERKCLIEPQGLRYEIVRLEWLMRNSDYNYPLGGSLTHSTILEECAGAFDYLL